MSKIVWRNGPPPSRGWWPTAPGVLRWWHGKVWSWACYQSDSVSFADYYGRRKAHAAVSRAVKWAYRPASWPKRSRT